MFAFRENTVFRLVAWLTLFWGTATAVVAQVQSATVQEQYLQETERFAEQLDAIAQSYPSESIATYVRSWQIPRAPDRQTLFLPPTLSKQSKARSSDSGLPAAIGDAQREHAQRLWQLALQALEEGHWQFAYRLAFEVAASDPSYADAKRIVDYTAVESPRPSGRVMTRNHPSLGWRAGRYWTVETDHFVIDSNDTPTAIQELAKALEVLHAVWRQVFVDYWSSRQEIEALFRGEPTQRTSTRHHVVLFNNQQQYQRALRVREPRIGMTLGIYRPADKTTYLYSNSRDAHDRQATWRHEATHQLFQELAPHQATPAEDGHAWIVEGTGMYMESMQQFDRCCTVGGIDAPRLQHARYRCLTEGKHEPLDRLIRLGRSQLQSRDDVRGLYSQAAGYTHFLMDGDDGSFRPALVEYLRQVYADTATPTMLSELLDRPWTDLEAQYRETFLPVRDRDLAFPQVSAAVVKLSLGRCPVTTAGVSQLQDAPIESITWFDLNHCAVDDSGVDWLERAREMRQLSLERTEITDETLRHIAGMQHLEELDLAGTAIGDDGLPHLAGLPRLRVLWLTDTAVTDRGMRALETLKSLKQLDLTGTKVTPETAARMRAGRPALKITGP